MCIVCVVCMCIKYQDCAQGQSCILSVVLPALLFMSFLSTGVLLLPALGDNPAVEVFKISYAS